MGAWLPYLPATFALAGALAALAFDATGRRTLAVLSACAFLFVGAVVGAWMVTVPAARGTVVSGSVGAVAPTVCLILAAFALLGGLSALGRLEAGGRVAALGALAAAAAAVVATAADFLVLFIAVEALAVAGYALVAAAGTDESREAAVKWFVQGSVATVVFVIGLAVLLSVSHGQLGYAGLEAAAAAGAAPRALVIGVSLVVVALAFKAGAFPFHSWAPDAYETAPSSASALLASAGKVAALVAILWVVVSAAGPSGSPALARVAALLAAGSIAFGNFAALRQRSLARMLAYSGIAQVGYALVAIPVVAASGTAAVPILAVVALVVFTIFYGIAIAAAFLVADAVRESDPAWDGTIASLAGLSRRRPVLAAALAVVLLSLTGIPLTAGFAGKFLVFASAATGGWLWLAVVGVVGSVVSFGYYGAVLRSAYLDDAGDEPLEVCPSAGPATRAVVLLAIAVAIFGVAALVFSPLTMLLSARF